MNKLIFASVLLLAADAFAAGTNVDLQSARATSMATAVTADSPDPSAVFFNPAQIVAGGKQKLRLQVGDTVLLPNITFTPEQGSQGTVTGPVPPFTAYLTYGITDNLAVGVGVFENYGLTIDWGKDWVGKDLIQKASLATYNINPEVAYRYGFLEIGAGMQIVRGTVDLTRALEFPGTQAGLELGGGAWGLGGNAGVRATFLHDLLSVGLTYRSQVNFEFDGKAHFSNVPVSFQGPANGQLHDQSVQTSMHTPDTIALGVSVHPIKALHINAETVYTTWQVFHRLTIKFDDPSLTQTEHKRWSNTFNLHLGGEYAVTPAWSVRLGFMYDPTPSPDNTLAPDVPDANRLNFAVGAGFHKWGFTADLGYQFILFMKTTSTLPALPGDYGGFVNAIGLSLGYDLAL